jgi:hypothetical protein
MALVYPLAMPLAGPSVQSFEPQPVDYLNPEASGRLGGVQAGETLWVASWDLGTLSRAQSNEWRAFFAALRGQRMHFLGRDYERPRPLAGLPVGFDACAGWSQSFDSYGTALLTLTGLPGGQRFSAGDYVGFRWTTGGAGRRSLVRSLEPVTASGAGVATFAVEPPVPRVTPAWAVAHLYRPACLMKRDMAQSKAPTMAGRRLAITATLAGVQDLLP